MAMGSWGARIPAVREGLDLSEGALGVALFGASVGAVAGAWLGGVAERRVGARRVIRCSWSAMALALALPGLAPSWGTLVSALVALGLCVGMLDVSMNAAAVRVEDAARRPLLSGLHAGWSAGLLGGAAIATAAVGAGLEPRPHLLAAGGILAAGAALCWRSLPDDQLGAQPRRPRPASVGAVGVGETGHLGPVPMRDPRMVAAAAIAACVFMGEGAAIDWSGVLVDEAFGGSNLQASLAVLGVSAGGLAGRLVADRAVAGLGAARVARRGALVAFAGLAGTLALADPGATPVLLFLLGFGLAPAVPLAFGAAARVRGSHGIAVATTAGYAAYLLGPPLIGGLSEAFGLRVGMLVPLTLVAAVVLLAGSLRGASPRPDLAPPLGAAD